RDTGMGRYGARSDAEALDALSAAAELPNVSPYAVWTHFATADEPASAYFDKQLHQFTEFVALARTDHPQLLAHAANSAATLRTPAAHFDFVRCGIAIYGLDPQNRNAADHQLIPALTLSSYVATVRTFEAGDHASYGCRFTASHPTQIATIPIGYGDGWPRILSNRCEVLIGGTRYRQVGTVSMDSIMVELGTGSGVAQGDKVTLIGNDGSDHISAEVIANQAETINYEITCDLTGRTLRAYSPNATASQAQ
ncbi:MAG: alanine racemase, partial [Thermoleophilaceae bacterium]|nr:alanine racemase [Thermoleophilaceae bacterium]